MSLPISNSNIPSWARQRLQDLRGLTEGDKTEAKGVTQRDLTPQDTVSHVGRSREILGETRLRDENPERDEALGEKGVVRSGNSETRYDGDARKGSWVSVSDERVSVMELTGTGFRRVDVTKDGKHDFALQADLAKPNDGKMWSAPSTNNEADVAPSEFSTSTIGSADFLQSLGEKNLFRQVFLDKTLPMPKVRGELMGSLQKDAEALPKEQAQSLQALLKEPNANTARKLGLALQELRKASPEDKTLQKLADTAGTWQALEDFPKLHSDGLMRHSVSYVGPAQLALQTASQGWEFDKKTGLPIADSVVVGGGPGGLSSAYHLSENGHRTVVLEGGHVGQAFSDNHAASVHQLRTSVGQTNLIYTANANHLGVDVALTRQRRNVPAKAAEARQEWYQATGQTEHGVSPTGTGLNRLANRNELFEHMSMINQGLAQKYPDTFVIENSPVTQIEASKGENGERLFQVTTERGHKMMARSLVMATGFVGTAGEHARTLKQFSELDTGPEGGVTVLGSDHDLVSKNERLQNETLVFSDRLLGRPEIRQRLKDLPANSRLAVVGGGESAAKGALEALHLNEGLKVDLYTKDPFEPYQTQIPTSVISPNVTEAALKHPDIAKQTLEKLENFKTPIVSSTMKQMMKFESEGRLRIREMGKRFEESTVDVKPKEGGGFQLQLKDPEVAQNLKSQRQDWESLGLYGTEPPERAPHEFPDADMVMSAVGYDRGPTQAGPLVQQLIDQGLVEYENGEVKMGQDGLTSSKDDKIAFNTAGVQKMAADSALPGRAVRAYRLGQLFKEKLPEREKPSETIAKGLKFNDFVNVNQSEEFVSSDRERAQSLLDLGGVFEPLKEHRENTIASIQDPVDKELASRQWETQKEYPSSAEPLRELLYREVEVPESLTPQERLILERAKDLRDRL